MIMNFEGLEQWRSEVTEETAKSLLEIVKDNKAAAADRIAAAKVIDAMSDSIIKAGLLSEVNQNQYDNNKQMIDKMDRLK